MFTLLNQQLADQHRAELQREAVTMRASAHMPEATGHRGFFLTWFDYARQLSRQPTVAAERKAEEVRLEEIRPAVLMTFSTLHKGGVVSAYDDTFIEQFVQTLEDELAHQHAAECV